MTPDNYFVAAVSLALAHVRALPSTHESQKKTASHPRALGKLILERVLWVENARKRLA